MDLHVTRDFRYAQMRQLESDRRLNIDKSNHECYGENEYYEISEEGLCESWRDHCKFHHRCAIWTTSRIWLDWDHEKKVYKERQQQELQSLKAQQGTEHYALNSR